MAQDHAATNGFRAGTEKLWEHPSPTTTKMWEFLQLVRRKHGLPSEEYQDLLDWSTAHLADFWKEIWDFTGVRSERSYDKVLHEDSDMFPPSQFFEGSALNFAENLLFPSPTVDSESTAVIAVTETTRKTVSWSQLRDAVRECQHGLMLTNLKVGDRVAGYVGNHANALVAMLAATSLGAIWTAISPDTGAHAVLERLRQIEPAVLFADNASFYNGRAHDVLGKVSEVSSSLPTLRATVIFPAVSHPSMDISKVGSVSAKVYDYASFVDGSDRHEKLEFRHLPPNHPVYILYSSGTTGAPKCIVHGAIGTLIQHKKEHMLHCSIGPGSRLFYFTTCTWMMWHWLVSGLACGATLVLYDGSPFRFLSQSDSSTSVPDDFAMPRLIDELGITHFGTSAKYLSVLEQKSVNPLDNGLSMSTLEAIYSTGSPLAPSTFRYVYSAFPPSINLGSITGGTDIISLFGAPNPLVSVYAGEIQAAGLGMAIRAWDIDGRNVTNTGESGDLVCVRPFPCQPVQFWGPEGAKKYRGSYFDRFPGVWHHGDYVRFNPKTGGLVMLGRSDGILKPAGVRFGSAEIYNVLLKHFPEQVTDALCIGRRRETDVDETVVLFLKMADNATFDEDIANRIKTMVKSELTARHVPGVIDECPEIPVTTNGKKVEGAVKQILCGMNVRISTAVANADCLDWYRSWAQSRP
ncbi:hypothetical protein BDY21DRAFT_327427 [Lineolata rhizophorae]|uniref:Acetoacetate-CoA ligase n=1 Tax=Lineolata rhizophorae TaxID=578093 RepID=A0A6A6NQD2_9PEZI|nr:hypothetical protein BDY21DRAFT_327427 [Lineolata rhizophorae]